MISPHHMFDISAFSCTAPLSTNGNVRGQAEGTDSGVIIIFHLAALLMGWPRASKHGWGSSIYLRAPSRHLFTRKLRRWLSYHIISYCITSFLKESGKQINTVEQCFSVQAYRRADRWGETRPQTWSRGFTHAANF